MEWVSVLVVCLLHLFIIRTEGYPQGAPSSACTFMTPSHYPASFQNSQSPFVIYTSSNTYVPEQNIQVTINTTTSTMQGFLIQARAVGSNVAIGSFTVPSTSVRTVDCGLGTDNAVTHSGRLGNVVSQTFTWEAPSTVQGDIEIRATVVKQYNTFWGNIVSSPLTFKTTTTTSTTTTTTPTTTTTIPTTTGSATQEQTTTPLTTTTITASSTEPITTVTSQNTEVRDNGVARENEVFVGTIVFSLCFSFHVVYNKYI